MKILYSLCQYYFLFRIYQSINIINKNNTENYIRKRKLSDSNLNTLNDLIYIYRNIDKIAYISSTKNEKCDIYITINTESPNSSRYLYLIKSDNTIHNKTLVIDSITHNKYPLTTLLNQNNDEYFVTFSHEGGQFEIIDYNQENIYYCRIFKVMKYNSLIQKNIFTKLKFYNNSDYILNAYIDKHDSNFIIQKLYYVDYNITKFKIQSTEKSLGNAFINSTVTCFEIDNFIECLYTNSNLLYTVSVFNITDLDNVYNEIIDENTVKYDELFSKCIYIKEQIGAFIYFTDNNNFPKIQFKTLIVNNNNYYLKDFFEPININSLGSFTFESNYIYNDIIKTNDNNIFYISTSYESILIYVILFKLLNNDKNILICNYEIKINSNYNIGIYKDITSFSFNGLLGIGITNHDYEIDNDKTYSSYFIIGNISLSDDISINIPNDINIFNEENCYFIRIDEIIEKINIKNNIFGYLIDGIKIISSLDESTIGFYIFSNKTKNKINKNELISKDDILNFKIISEIGVKLDKYIIEYEVIIKESEFEDFISYPYQVEYFPYNISINNEIQFKSFFIPETFPVKKSHITFSVNECYNKCEMCSFYGDDLNHHCDICSKNFPFSVNIKNEKNCYKECSDIFIVNENNICIINTKHMEEESIFPNLEENKCKKFFYIDENSKINCIDGDLCIDEYPHLDKNIKNMCTNCIVKYKNKCYFDCPENTCIKQDLNMDTCIDINQNAKVINQICFENFINLAKNIKEMSEKNIIINNIPNLIIYGYDIEKDINYFKENNLTYIYFKDIKDKLIQIYNLDSNDNIYALLVDSASKFSNSTINDYGFVLLLENGTELDLSYINENIKINISIPIVNLNLAKFNYATIFSEQGYDIYDKNSEFYHDIESSI